MKNLVMSVAKGYGWYDLEPFILSFKQNCKNADLVLFVDDLSDFTLYCLKSKGGGINLIPIPDNLRDKTIVTVRFIMYKNFIETHPEYERIFVTDIRDVIFQGDIFATYEDYDKFLAYSTLKYTISSSILDSQWINNVFSEEVYQKLKDNLVICAGMFLGTRAEIIILFEHMIELFPNETVWGDDQAIVNYLIYNQQLPIKNMLESKVDNGKFINLGVINSQHYAFASGDKILCKDGGIPDVVHQWTGYSYSIEVVDRVYHEKDFQPDERFTDFKSSLEQVMCLVYSENWIAATKLFVTNVLYDDNLSKYGDKIVAIYEKIIKVPNQNLESEILLVALQKAIVYSFNSVSDVMIWKFYNLFNTLELNSRAVNIQFRMYMQDVLTRLAKYLAENNYRDLCLEAIEKSLKLGLPISADVYLLQAEVYRKLGRKSEALQAYEKAIDATQRSD